MPRVLLYEFASSGGLMGYDASEAAESIRREGAAMLAALARDFADMPGVETLVMVADDAPLKVHACQRIPVRAPKTDVALLADWCRQVDWTAVIAPEFNELLMARCRLVESSGGRLLGPSSAVVALAGDKQQTAEHLAAAGVKVPQGVGISPGDSLPDSVIFPAVVKPRFGAGSDGVRLLQDRAAWDDLTKTMRSDVRIERFCAGIAASVAFLCGPAGRFPLPPCRQRLSDDGEFRYLGGNLPLPEPLAARAAELASLAIATLDHPVGYLGVDLVLGDRADGSEDVVIEINPRLTTSYVGLRALARDNLAAAVLAVADGKRPRLSFAAGRLQFDSDGKVRAL